MQPVKTIWEWSLESEAKRTIHCAHQIVTGFFRYNNFFLTPWKLGNNPNPMMVTFPDLHYQTIPRFWDKVKRVDIKNFPLEFETELVKAVKKLVETMGLTAPEMRGVKETWKEASKDILDEILRLAPLAQDDGFPTLCHSERSEGSRRGPSSRPAARISEIIIHPTNFGATCSFSIADKFPAAVEMYLRADQDIYSITEAILSAVTRNEVYRDLDGMWSESELLVDWLIMKSSLSPILKKYQLRTNFMPTVKYTRMKQNARLMKKSEEFYRRLGAPVLENSFGLKDGQPTVAGRPLTSISPREREILAAMISKSNSVVTIDELADLLFSDDEEFSLAAIAKTIQRLRDKLEKNGISGSFIQTLRGQGYVLKN